MQDIPIISRIIGISRRLVGDNVRNVLIHYFTGTGNTYHAVKLLSNILQQNGCQINYKNMEEAQKQQSISYDLHVFAFPVYGFGMPAIVKSYLRDLEPTANVSACILSIGGVTGLSGSILDSAFEGDALIMASKLLRRKGYSVKLTELLGYPENWTQVNNPPNEETQAIINEAVDKRIPAIADMLMSGAQNLRSIPIVPYILSKLVNFAYSRIGRRVLGKLFVTDGNCNGCGKCSRICPVHNIKIKRSTPQWGWRCEGCQRCINACSSSAVQTSTLRTITLLAAQIAPIFLVVGINKRLPINGLMDILLYGIIAFILTIAVDWVIYILEILPFTRKVAQVNFTSKFRRYLSKDIHF